jgi:hypothetical protein
MEKCSDVICQQWKDILKKIFVVIMDGAKTKLLVEIYLRK